MKDFLYNLYKILIFIPGTIVHEFMHYIIGLIFLAKPVNFTIIPKFRNNKIILGSVSFRNVNNINAFPIAIAPLLAIPLILYIDYYIFNFNIIHSINSLLNYDINSLDKLLIKLNMNLLRLFFILYLNFVIIVNAIPSSQDIKVALSKPVGTFLWISILFFICYKLI